MHGVLTHVIESDVSDDAVKTVVRDSSAIWLLKKATLHRHLQFVYLGYQERIFCRYINSAFIWDTKCEIWELS